MNKKKKTFLKLNLNQWIAIFGILLMLMVTIGEVISYY